MKYTLSVALCFIALVVRMCRPEAWAVRGKASMPEAPLSGAALRHNVGVVYAGR